MKRFWTAIPVLLAAVATCGGSGSGVLGSPVTTYSIERQEASVYRTEATPRSATATERDRALCRLIESESESAGRRLGGDGRLDELASWVMENLNQDGTPPPFEALDFAARHFGLPEPAPHLFVAGVSGGDSLEQQLKQKISEIMARQDYTHYGLAYREIDGTAFLAIAFSWRWFQMSKAARGLPANAVIRLKGRLTSGHRNPSIALTKPDNTTLQQTGGKGPSFDLSIMADQIGTYRLELLAQGQHGATVLANFPIYVGVPIPRRIDIAGTDSARQGEGDSDFVPRLHGLINQTRAQHGLEPLDLDAELSEVALAHCIDMDRNGFIGHDSPQTGTAADRAKKAGIQSPIVLENIGRGYSAREVHSGLMQSPAHRANILSREVTHVGIGLVKQDEGSKPAYLVTQVFIRVVADIDLGKAPDELLDLINDARASRGLDEVASDDMLSEYARQAALSYFARPDLSDKMLAKRINQRLGKTADRFRQVATLLKLADSLERIKEVSQLFDPEITTVGIGIAQGTKEGEMPNAIIIVLIMAWQR
ncbi:MAG: CAP domain-containing protein [Deltaproteobacteria bacterium]|nr:CAP domain-containing protein [Deltaproteobacteria bacterium]